MLESNWGKCSFTAVGHGFAVVIGQADLRYRFDITEHADSVQQRITPARLVLPASSIYERYSCSTLRGYPKQAPWKWCQWINLTSFPHWAIMTSGHSALFQATFVEILLPVKALRASLRFFNPFVDQDPPPVAIGDVQQWQSNRLFKLAGHLASYWYKISKEVSAPAA